MTSRFCAACLAHSIPGCCVICAGSQRLIAVFVLWHYDISISVYREVAPRSPGRTEKRSFKTHMLLPLRKKLMVAEFCSVWNLLIFDYIDRLCYVRIVRKRHIFLNALQRLSKRPCLDQTNYCLSFLLVLWLGIFLNLFCLVDVAHGLFRRNGVESYLRLKQTMITEPFSFYLILPSERLGRRDLLS